MPVARECTLEIVVPGVSVGPDSLDPLVTIATSGGSRSGLSVLPTNLLLIGSCWSVTLILVIVNSLQLSFSISNRPLVQHGLLKHEVVVVHVTKVPGVGLP